MGMIYFAHRGASAQRVQNTLEAFALAKEQGATHYELDVHLLKDGKLAVHHNYSLLETAGKDVALGDLTSADLTKFPLINPFTQNKVAVPLLQEVLPIIAPGLQLLNIELKNDGNIYPGIEGRLLDFLGQYSHLNTKIIFSSFDYDSLVRLRAAAPQARVGLLTRQFDIEKARALRAESVHINHIRFVPDMARICHQHGIKLYCYTVNDKSLAAKLQAQGVDGIFTDQILLYR